MTNDQSVRVRRAGREDIPTLVEFNRAMARESEDKGLNVETLTRGVTYLLNHPDEGCYLVAEVGADAAGTLMLTFEWSDWRNGRFWWIQSVYVAQPLRRRGVYRALHAEAKRLARQDPQCCGIRLYVEKNNTPAQATYSSLGMDQTGYLLFEEEF